MVLAPLGAEKMEVAVALDTSPEMSAAAREDEGQQKVLAAWQVPCDIQAMTLDLQQGWESRQHNSSMDTVAMYVAASGSTVCHVSGRLTHRQLGSPHLT